MTTTSSRGDPRVLAAMNLVLSAAFSGVVVRGLAFVDVLAFTWRAVAALTLVLFVVTYVVVLR